MAASDSFYETDGCKVFSGDVGAFSKTGIPHTPYIWSADSSNRVPVALLHDMEESTQTRSENAKTQLRALVADITNLFKEIDLSASRAISGWQRFR